MSNTREKYLKKQIERQANQIQVLITAFGNAVTENEYLSSVACGFAWDLQVTLDHAYQSGSNAEDLGIHTENLWFEAVLVAEQQNLEAK